MSIGFVYQEGEAARREDRFYLDKNFREEPPIKYEVRPDGLYLVKREGAVRIFQGEALLSLP